MRPRSFSGPSDQPGLGSAASGQESCDCNRPLHGLARGFMADSRARTRPHVAPRRGRLLGPARRARTSATGAPRVRWSGLDLVAACYEPLLDSAV